MRRAAPVGANIERSVGNGYLGHCWSSWERLASLIQLQDALKFGLIQGYFRG